MAWIINEETQVKWEIEDEELMTRLLAMDHYKEVITEASVKKNTKPTGKEK